MVIAWSRIPPDSWSVGLQVMLEKIAGLCLVEKLHAIQLYEADFNCYNQFVFDKQAMQTLTDRGYKRNSSARKEARPRMQSLTRR
jgi:hypothetical protein